MLELSRGKRIVYVGDSLNRNMWESMICMLRNCVMNQTNVFEASGKVEFKTKGSYSFLFTVSFSYLMLLIIMMVIPISMNEVYLLVIIWIVLMYCQNYNFSVEFFRSNFLVQEWWMPDGNGSNKETLRIDLMEKESERYEKADVLIFNTGHWWTHSKTSSG